MCGERVTAPGFESAVEVLDVGAEQRVGRRPERLPEQLDRVISVARASVVVRGVEEAPRTRLVVRRESRGTLECAGRRRVRAPSAGDEGGLDESRSNVLVGRRGRSRPVPGALLGRALACRCVRECSVYRPKLLGRDRVVGGRAQERVPEAHLAVPHDDDAGGLGRGEVPRDTERLQCAGQRPRAGICGEYHEGASHRGRQAFDPRRVGALEARAGR